MSIMSGGMRQTMELLDKLSVPQIQQGMKAGRYPAYLAIPAIELKTRMQKQFEQQKLLQQPSPKNMPTVAQQVMQEAQGMGSSMGAEIGAGVDGLPSNLPQEYAAGGIVAFDEGGEVERYQMGGELGMAAGMGGYEPPEERRWNPFTMNYDPLTEEQKKILAAAEEEQRRTYGWRPDKAPTGTPAPTTPPATKPPAAGLGAGVAPAGPAGIQGIFAQLPEYKPSKTTEQRFSEFAPGFREAIQGIETRRKEETEKLRGQITGQAYEGLEKQLQKEAEESGMDKDQAKNMAIFKAGLAMMAGTSRNALQNIGAGAMVGAEDYQKAAAEIKKAQKENQRMMAHIEQARRAEKRGDVDRQMEELNKASDRELKVEEFLSKGMFEAGIKDEDAQREMFKNRLTVAGRLGEAQTQAGARTQGRGEMTAANRLAAMKLLENKEPAIHQKAIAMLGFKPDMKNPKHVVAYNEAKDKVTKEELNNILRTIGGESFGAYEVPTTDLGSQGYKVIRNP